MRTQDHFYVTRRSDGYVSAANGYRPRDFSGNGEQTTFELIAEGSDWDRMRAVILVERGGLRIDEAVRYRLRLTEQRRGRVLGGEDREEPTVREWEADGAGLRELLWECAAGAHEKLPERSYFDRAGYDGRVFRLQGLVPSGDVVLEVTECEGTVGA
ncbi:hypothetical protein ACIRPQ_29375 [Streptomyces sp. NPDC101213]|uniref:hypothetical protein n=1 Tax=Streptomyces sp. NPDC101213 TaxID=3366130 RepID=UPI0037F44878